MELRRGSAVVVGLAVMLVLTGCQSTERGHTGLMLAGNGAVYGVVHVCEGSVTTFDLRTGDSRLVEGWDFAEPVTDSGTVMLGQVSDITDIISQVPVAYFAGGSDGDQQVTTPLRSPAAAIDQLIVNQVLYTDLDAAGAQVLTAASLDEFAALSCERY